MQNTRLWADIDHDNTIYSMPVHQNLPFFHEDTAKNGCFFGENLSFLASDKRLKDSLPYFEGAGCEKAGCRHRQIAKTQFTASLCKNLPFLLKKRPRMTSFLLNN